MRYALIFSLVLLSGCTTWWQTLSGESPRQGQSSSLVEFLYPAGDKPPPISEETPVLDLPIRVGLAFVPSAHASSRDLPEATRNRLLERTRAEFLDKDYIADIVVIPESYLAGTSGFGALDQVGRVFGLDVIAMVSYDQVSVADDRAGSLLYWTVVGAYLVKGSRNDVSTFVDTAVFDLGTHRLLFRAPGRNQHTESATLIGSGDAMRKAREASFERAMSDMATNLATELDRFEERIRTDRSVVVRQRNPSRGGGAVAPWLLLLLGALTLIRRWHQA